MAVTSSMIAHVSPYTVGDLLPFSTTLYTLYSAIAKVKLDAEAPSLPQAVYDYCHALLIVHLYEVKRGATNVKSKSFGNASLTKGDDRSNYLAEYEGVIAAYRKAAGMAALTGGVVRSDATMTKLHLDNGEISNYEDDPAVDLWR